ncbi:MAG TPA: ATP-binding protein, partial [Gemmataceae bacterium]|nr:ATP-binding protein [Gemmataceae bacterium]
VSFEHSGLGRRLFPPEVETAAFRIIQEALTNVARHARVPEVTVRISLDQDLLSMKVEDHGAGFNPQAVFTVANSGGLSGMQERAVLLGGYLVVDSEPGSGTRVLAELPVLGAEERRRHAFDPVAGR